MRPLGSRVQFELFFLAFIVCLVVTWFTIIAKNEYVVFTDPETVPSSTDFFAGFIGSSEEADIDE